MPNLRFLFSLLTGVVLFCCTQAMGQSQGNGTIRDRIWIWGHPAGVHNDSFLANLPKKSTIEPVAAADYMGIRNMIFVRYDGKPVPPFDTYYVPFQKLDRVYWSLVGASGATSADEREQVFQLAEKHDNLVGFILDDFFHSKATGPGADPETEADNLPPFEASLSPKELHALGQRKVRGRNLPIMAVVYTGQISKRAKAHIAEVDQVCLWTWRPADLEDLETNLARLEKAHPRQADLSRLLHLQLCRQSTASRRNDEAPDGAGLPMAQGRAHRGHNLSGHAQRGCRPGVRRLDARLDLLASATTRTIGDRQEYKVCCQRTETKWNTRVAPMIFRKPLPVINDNAGKSSVLPWQQEVCSQLRTPTRPSIPPVAHGGPTHGHAGRDEIAQPPPCVQRQPVFGEPVQDAQVPAGIPQSLWLPGRRSPLLSRLLPLVQRGTLPLRDRHAVIALPPVLRKR